MKAGVIVDDYKLPVYEKHLKRDTWTYEKKGHLTPGITVLTVDFNDQHALKATLERAEHEYQRGKTLQ
jgi:hypothetical protein